VQTKVYSSNQNTTVLVTTHLHAAINFSSQDIYLMRQRTEDQPDTPSLRGMDSPS